MANESNESKLGPPRLTRLDAEVDAAVLKIAQKEERPVAAVLRRLVRKALQKAA